MAVYDSLGRPVIVDILSASTTVFSAGVMGAGVSTLGATAGNTGTVSNRVVLAGSGGITLSQGTDASGGTVWIQAPAEIGGNVVSLSGNTAGTLSTQSTGTFVFAGGSNITLSQSSNSVSIIGASGGSGADGVNVVSISGNTAGTLSSQSTGTVVLAGGNNITLSQSSNTISIIGASGGTGGGGVAISGGTGTNASNVTAGTVSLVDSNNVKFGFDTASKLTASVNHGSLSVSMQDLDYLASSNSNGITLNITNRYVTDYLEAIWAMSGTNTATYIDMSKSSVSFSNANGVSFGATPTSIGGGPFFTGWVITASISGGTGGADGVNILSASGNTAGTLSTQSTGTMVLAGGANITLSQSSNTISVIGVSPAAGSVNFSAGTSSSNLTQLKFVDSNGISFGLQTGSVITATVKTDYQSSGAYLTTAMQSACSSVFAKTGFTTASTGGSDIAGTLNTNGLSMGIPKYLTTAMQSGAATISNINVSAGTTSSNLSAMQFINSNGISFGLDTASKLTATVATNYQSQGAYLTTARASNDAVGLNTAQTNVTWTVNSSGISINAGGYAGSSTGTQSTTGTDIVLTHNTLGLNIGVPKYLTTAQPVGAYLTTARASNDAVGLNTAQTNVTWTVNSSGLSLNAAGYAGTGTSATNANITLNSNGLAISVNAGAADGVNVVGISGNTLGATSTQSSGTIYLAGGNNITLSQNSNSITISGANVGGAQTGISGLGNSATTFTSGSVILSEQANITIGSSLNGASQYLRFSVGNYITTARASNDAVGLNTAQTNVTWTVNSSGLSINAGGYAGSSTGTQSTAGSDIVLTHNTLGLNLGVPKYLTTAMASNAATITAINISASSTSTNATAFTFVNSNGVTFGLGTGASAGQITATVATNYQSAGAYLTTARASNDAVGLNTAQTNVTWTVNSSGISINAGGYAGSSTGTQSTGGSDLVMTHNTLGLNLGVPKWITTYPAQTQQQGSVYASSNTFGTSSGTYDARTLSIAGSGAVSVAASNSGWVISAPVAMASNANTSFVGLNSAQTNVTWTVNSSGISLNASGYAGTSTGFTGANISASMTHNTLGLALSMSVAAPGAAAENNWINLGGNTAGGSTASGSTIKWYGGANITLQATNGSEVSIVGGAGGGGAAVGLSTGGNTAGVTKTWTSGTVVLAGSNSLTISNSTDANGGTLWLQPAMSQLTAGNLISLSSNGSTISVIGLGAGTGSGFTGTNVSATITHNTAGLSLQLSAGGGGGGIAAGVSNTGNTAGNTGTYSTGTIVFAASNSMTLSQSSGAGSVHTIWMLPLLSALSGGGGISLSTTGSTIVIYTV